MLPEMHAGVAAIGSVGGAVGAIGAGAHRPHAHKSSLPFQRHFHDLTRFGAKRSGLGTSRS